MGDEIRPVKGERERESDRGCEPCGPVHHIIILQVLNVYGACGLCQKCCSRILVKKLICLISGQ